MQGQPLPTSCSRALSAQVSLTFPSGPFTIHLDGLGMVCGWYGVLEMSIVEQVGLTRSGATEKLTINLGVVDLGQIDLLVQEGFYSNRTDLIRTAIRSQLSLHAEEVKKTIARRTLTLGLQDISRDELQRAEAAGEMLRVQVVGLVRIADDVSAELARATIQSIVVLGALHANAAVRAALADRIS